MGNKVRCTITIDYDYDDQSLEVAMDNDPPCSDPQEANEHNRAALYGALVRHFLDKACQARCFYCVGSITEQIPQMADALHDGQVAVEEVRAAAEGDTPNYH